MTMIHSIHAEWGEYVNIVCTSSRPGVYIRYYYYYYETLCLCTHIHTHVKTNTPEFYIIKQYIYCVHYVVYAHAPPTITWNNILLMYCASPIVPYHHHTALARTHNTCLSASTTRWWRTTLGKNSTRTGVSKDELFPENSLRSYNVLLF